jgi:hypothetical protein
MTKDASMPIWGYGLLVVTMFKMGMWSLHDSSIAKCRIRLWMMHAIGLFCVLSLGYCALLA